MKSSRSSAIRKFKEFFPRGFYDPKYLAWERNYKWEAHLKWEEDLNETEFRTLLKKSQFSEIARRAARIESKTNLLFSFEKMALRDAVKSEEGAEIFSRALFHFLYNDQDPQKSFEKFSNAIALLPRKQTRVQTWPLMTVFGFIAKPEEHIFLKPVVTKKAAENYGFEFKYRSGPNWETYKSLLDFAKKIKEELRGLKPRDYIDLQSFIWVQGSSEYD